MAISDPQHQILDSIHYFSELDSADLEFLFKLANFLSTNSGQKYLFKGKEIRAVQINGRYFLRDFAQARKLFLSNPRIADGLSRIDFEKLKETQLLQQIIQSILVIQLTDQQTKFNEHQQIDPATLDQLVKNYQAVQNLDTTKPKNNLVTAGNISLSQQLAIIALFEEKRLQKIEDAIIASMQAKGELDFDHYEVLIRKFVHLEVEKVFARIGYLKSQGISVNQEELFANLFESVEASIFESNQIEFLKKEAEKEYRQAGTGVDISQYYKAKEGITNSSDNFASLVSQFKTNYGLSDLDALKAAAICEKTLLEGKGPHQAYVQALMEIGIKPDQAVRIVSQKTNISQLENSSNYANYGQHVKIKGKNVILDQINGEDSLDVLQRENLKRARDGEDLLSFSDFQKLQLGMESSDQGNYEVQPEYFNSHPDVSYHTGPTPMEGSARGFFNLGKGLFKQGAARLASSAAMGLASKLGLAATGAGAPVAAALAAKDLLGKIPGVNNLLAATPLGKTFAIGNFFNRHKGKILAAAGGGLYFLASKLAALANTVFGAVGGILGGIGGGILGSALGPLGTVAGVGAGALIGAKAGQAIGQAFANSGGVGGMASTAGATIQTTINGATVFSTTGLTITVPVTIAIGTTALVSIINMNYLLSAFTLPPFENGGGFVTPIIRPLSCQQPIAADFPDRLPVDKGYCVTAGTNVRTSKSVHGNAMDIYLPEKTPIYATHNGTIAKVGNDPGGYGRYVDIKSDNGKYTTRYAHLSKINPDIKVNSKINSGEQIGLSGNTGNSTGPHLHYELITFDEDYSKTAIFCKTGLKEYESKLIKDFIDGSCQIKTS